MAYFVNLTARAKRDLAFLFSAINAEYSEAALEWYRGLRNAILSLEHSPGRCPATHEDKNLRNLLYGRKPHVYRVIYHVQEARKRVDVLHIRHGARRSFKASEFA